MFLKEKVLTNQYINEHNCIVLDGSLADLKTFSRGKHKIHQLKRPIRTDMVTEVFYNGFTSKVLFRKCMALAFTEEPEIFSTFLHAKADLSSELTIQLSEVLGISVEFLA